MNAFSSRFLARPRTVFLGVSVLAFGLACGGLGAAWGATGGAGALQGAGAQGALPGVGGFSGSVLLALAAGLLTVLVLGWWGRAAWRARQSAARLQEIRRTLEGGMVALGQSLEARGLETPGHTERVARLALDLGRALGLSDEQQEQLRQGALLHDLGKLNLESALFDKNARLSPEQQALARSHPERGFDTAAQLPGLSRGTLSVIRYHHERWDGGGYPSGLSGTQIPPLARIFAVCDVYDALVGAREGKVTWSHDAALLELAAQAGRQLDPGAVEVFLRLPPPTPSPSTEASTEAAPSVAVELPRPSVPRLLN